jgi:hypothetical protein
MSKRLPRPNLLRGLVKRRIVGDDKATIALINSRLDNPVTYRALNDYYSTNQGNRWINRFKVWTDWLWKHREAIMRVLGLVIMFADDGSPVVKTIEEVEAEKAAAEKAAAEKATAEKAVAEKAKKTVKKTDKVTVETVVVTPHENPLDSK